MSPSPVQYTRKFRVVPALLALIFAAGGLPAHSFAAAPAPEQAMDIIPGAWWEDDFEFYLALLLEMLNRWPPPVFEDPADAKLDHFNQGYLTVGLREDLTGDQRTFYSGIVLDFMEHLNNDPGFISQPVRDQAMINLINILVELEG